MEALFAAAKSAIDSHERPLHDLGNEIWRNPELGNQEFRAHKVLTAFLRDRGFDVEEQFHFPTGFRATFGKKDGGPHVCLLCEYDALPQLGHASGHNLVAEASVAAAVGIKAGIETGDKAIGKVTVLGTPDKDGSGRKTELINNHFFKDVDFAMTVQPYMANIAKPLILQVMRVHLRYEGKTANASCQPWEARNALDAAVQCYNNISSLRQQLKPHMQIHGKEHRDGFIVGRQLCWKDHLAFSWMSVQADGWMLPCRSSTKKVILKAIISNGGVRPNIIPAETEMKVYLRARDHVDMAVLTQKANAAFVAAGKATGCETHFNFTETPYSALLSNDPLADTYQRHAESLGITFTKDMDMLLTSAGSTDTGNVSHIIPCILPTYAIGTDASYQSEAFAEAVGTEDAHKASILVSKAVALTALEVMSKTELMQEIKNFSRADSPTQLLTSWP